jgi:type II secretory pathway component GspD/PulD (secretin)
VTVKRKDEKVSEVLKAIVKPYNLGYAIIGDSVFVSTDDMAMLRQLKQHITVDIEKVELAKALEQLKRETATNIVLDAKATKEGKTIVTLQIDDVPLETAVRLLAEMAGLKVVRNANVLYVTPRGNASELRKTGAAQGLWDTGYGDGRSIRRFGDRLGGRAISTDIDESGPAADTLPLTEPLRPAPSKTQNRRARPCTKGRGQEALIRTRHLASIAKGT